MTGNKDGISGTAPQFEVNYGLSANADLHIIVPLSYVSPNKGSTQYGFGDTELGVKYRFVQESDGFPIVGTFPLVEMPAGNHKQGLGSGAREGIYSTLAPKELGRMDDLWRG